MEIVFNVLTIHTFHYILSNVFHVQLIVHFVINPKLAMVIKAPCEQLALIIEVERGMVAAENIDCLFCANCLDLHGLLVLVSGRQQASNLAGLRIPPSKNFSIFAQCKRVMRA